jgi:hypothetical protein
MKILNVLTDFWRIIGAFAKLSKASISFIASVRSSVRLSAWNNLVPNIRVLMKFDISNFQNFVEKIQVSLKSDKNK